MRPLTTISVICLLYLPLYADEVTPSEVQETQPINLESSIEEKVQVENIQEKKSQEVIKTQQPTISTLINEVKNAPDEQKRVLMNQLKIQLKSMNQESRHQAMMELKKSFSTKGEGEEKHQNREYKSHQQRDHESCQHGNHQPKFRHLRQGAQDGTGPKGDGRGGHGEGQNRQGEGHK